MELRVKFDEKVGKLILCEIEGKQLGKEVEGLVKEVKERSGVVERQKDEISKLKNEVEFSTGNINKLKALLLQ